VHPHLSTTEGERAAGLQLTPRGGLAIVADDEAVRQAIHLLLSTTPGERVMRPGYGCHLRRLVFAPNDDTTAGLAIHYVRQALEMWEPRIEIERIDAGPDPIDPERLRISLDYRVRATARRDSLVYPLDLAGARA
jgi:phage baseplate assembly protein W